MEDGREIENQARLISQDAPAVVSNDPATDLPDDPTRFIVESETTLLVEKIDEAVGDGAFAPGTEVTYTLRLRSGGSQRALGLEVSDTVPDLLTVTSASLNGQIQGQTVTWSQDQVPALAAMNPGDEVLLTVTATIDPRAINGDVVANQARVVGQTLPEAVLSNDPDTAAADDPTEFIVGSPELAFTKQVSEAVEDGVFALVRRYATPRQSKSRNGRCPPSGNHRSTERIFGRC